VPGVPLAGAGEGQRHAVAAAHVLRGVTAAPLRYRVRIRFAAPAAALAERSSPTSGRITPLGDGECELATGSDSLHDLATYLGRFEVPFTVLDPPELRDFLRSLAARYAAAASG
jgi:hypothetical protein